jgi:hypothetical protein
VHKDNELTYEIPRFLSFIELGYMLEAAKIADAEISKKITEATGDEKNDIIGNTNATRQSLLRAVFVSAYAILEQHLDEISLMEKDLVSASLSPSDLKDRGIKRSIKYVNKVLGKNIDQSKEHWKDLISLQDLRNHLVHYGPSFSNDREHENRWKKFKTLKYVSLRPMICFSLEQIEDIFSLFMVCVDDFSK